LVTQGDFSEALCELLYKIRPKLATRCIHETGQLIAPKSDFTLDSPKIFF